VVQPEGAAEAPWIGGGVYHLQPLLVDLVRLVRDHTGVAPPDALGIGIVGLERFDAFDRESLTS